MVLLCCFFFSHVSAQRSFVKYINEDERKLDLTVLITFYYLPIEAGEKIFKHFWYKMTHYVIIEFMQFVEKRSYLKIVNICSNSRVHACLLIWGYRLPVYYLIEDATFFFYFQVIPKSTWELSAVMKLCILNFMIKTIMQVSFF